MDEARGRYALARGFLGAALTLCSPAAAFAGHHPGVKVKVVQHGAGTTRINVTSGTTAQVGSSAQAASPGTYLLAPVSGGAAAASVSGGVSSAPTTTIRIKSGAGVVEIDRALLLSAGNGPSSAPATQSAPATNQTYSLVASAPVQAAPAAQYQVQAAPAAQYQLMSAPAQYQLVAAPTTQTPVQAAPSGQYLVQAAPTAQPLAQAAPTAQAPVQYLTQAAPATTLAASGGTVVIINKKHCLFH